MSSNFFQWTKLKVGHYIVRRSIPNQQQTSHNTVSMYLGIEIILTWKQEKNVLCSSILQQLPHSIFEWGSKICCSFLLVIRYFLKARSFIGQRSKNTQNLYSFD